MVFVDPYLLTVTLVFTLLLIFGNIYFLAHYAHYADSFFGSSTACKAVLILGYIIAEAQMFMLALDVQNTREDTNFKMYMFWYIVYMSSLFYVTVALPFGLFFAETDEEKEFKWRICSAFKNEVITLVAISIFLFPCYVAMNYAYIPILANTCSWDPNAGLDPFIAAETVVTVYDSFCVESALEMEIRVGFQIFVITVMTFIGWFFLVFFVPTGMQALPFELIADWIMRPKPMREDEFNRSKAELAKKVATLMDQGKKLSNSKKGIQEKTRKMWFWTRWRAKRELTAQQNLFETNCMLAEREFQKLDLVAQYGQKVEPMVYICKLIVGIILAGVSVLFLAHWFSYIVIKIDDKPVNPMVNEWLENTEQSMFAFLSTVFMVAIGFYFALAGIKGNIKFGIRFFFVSFYPIVPKETFVNSFIANCMILNVWMVALVQFLNVQFRGYLRNTAVAKIFQVQVANMYFFGPIFASEVFYVMIVVWWFIALIYLILKPIEKINLGNQVKRADLSAKI